MDLNPDLSELTGTLIGDGCLSKFFSRSENRIRKVIAFTGNLDEFDYYSAFVQPAFQKYFGVTGRLYTRDNNSTRFDVKSVRAFEFFSGLGIPVGKKSHSVYIPKQIFKNRDLLIPCLRGIWDSDGSIYRRYSKAYSKHSKHYSNLNSMSFKSCSRRLAREVHRGLEIAGIRPNRVVDCGDSSRFYITRQSEVRKFLELIGFRNSHHLRRLERLSLSPIGI
ncbi:MAG: hypothetical protein NUV67_02965 [archaeon]|nr:hypothetical protein [archaeon]